MPSYIVRTSTLGVALIGGLFSLTSTAFAQQNAPGILDSARAESPAIPSMASANHGVADRLARALEIHNNPDKHVSQKTDFDISTEQPADYPVAADLAARLHDHEIASSIEVSRAESQRRVADTPAADSHPKADEIAQRLADYYASNGPAMR